MSRFRIFGFLLVAATLAVAAVPAKAGLFTQANAQPQARKQHPIKHLVFIVEENRSFDEYFGTYPGADGLPTSAPCQVSDWYPSQCFTPYPNHKASNQGGPYTNPYQLNDIDGGKMDGFRLSREEQLGPGCVPPRGRPFDPHKIVGVETDDEGIHTVKACIVDVLGYHTQKDIPNYWAYAQNYVLFDHFYESVMGYSLPAHLAIFSTWSAICTQVNPPNVNSCASSTGGKVWGGPAGDVIYLWTDITYLLYQNHISWEAYLDGGLDPSTNPFGHTGVQYIWDVLPGFETVNDDDQVPNAEVTLAPQFYSDAANGTLPQVSWVLPNYDDSDHPQASIKAGQSYVTGLIDAIEAGPDWKNTAIVLFWDDMGGFYDHEPPPFAIDSNGPGLRTPAILISPYAYTGLVDHQIVTSDTLVKLIEEVFLKDESIGQSGRSDPRPDYRDQSTQLGDMMKDFNFSQAPRRPLILPVHPVTTLIDNPQEDYSFDPDEPGPRIR